MGFENPELLLFLLAVFLPIIISIFRKRKAKSIHFSALKFLLLREEKVRSRLKVRHSLLLLVRIGIILSLVVAFAAPYFLKKESEVWVSQKNPSSVVLIIDNSMSMNYKDEDGELLDKAKKQAKNIIEGLPQYSEIEIITSKKEPQILNGERTLNKKDALKILSKIKPTFEVVNIRKSFNLAFKLMEKKVFSKKEIVLIGDFCGSIIEELKKISFPEGIGITFIDVLKKEKNFNRGIVDVKTSIASDISPSHIRIVVSVRNFGEEKLTELITVEVDERIIKGYLEINPYKIAKKEFLMKVGRKKDISGSVSIPPDNFVEDDRRDFVIDIEKEIPILIVNGSPRDIPYLDEAYYLTKAIKPDAVQYSPFLLLSVIPSEVSISQLQHIDVVFLINVRTIEKDVVGEILNFVKNGGGVFISTGDNVNAEEYNKIFEALLPFPLKESKKSEKINISIWDIKHEIFNPFHHYGEGTPAVALFEKYFIMEPANNSDGKILMKFENSFPALVERKIGMGSVLVFSSTIDTDWNDFPLKSSFLPFIHSVIKYFVKDKKIEFEKNIEVGEAKKIKVLDKANIINITLPDNTKEVIKIKKGEKIIEFVNTQIPGIYTINHLISEKKEPILVENFSVYPPSMEGDFRREGLNEFMAKFIPKKMAEKNEINLIKKPVWHYLLFIIFLLLFIEAYLLLKSVV